MNPPKQPLPAENHVPGTCHRDYVIRDGKYIGEFEDMYQNAVEIPWHQDETVNVIFSDLTVAILRRHPASPFRKRDQFCAWKPCRTLKRT